MHKILAILLITLCLAIGPSMQARSSDEFSTLPLAGPMPTKSYSGYLRTASPNRKLHYIFVESFSAPSEDPILVWFNGGPGCSSMLGFIQEHGPYKIDDFTDVIDANPEPWNKRANVLYLESPAGVGYTYASNREDLNWLTDHLQSVDTFTAIRDFYDSWPELLTNKLWITGESYGGIYGPYLAYQIHTWNQELLAKRASGQHVSAGR